MRNAPEITFPTADMTRIPFAIYHDREVYEAEQHQIFRGPVWCYLGFEAELPKPGDFITTYVGDTPVIVSRDLSGQLHAMVNRCSHRGATVRRESCGHDSVHTCCYHQWSYSLSGDLLGIPFRRGVNGKGGLPPDFDMSKHGLRKLRIESFKGAIFGTLSDVAEPLADYLDAPVVEQLTRLLHKPVRVLGYQRQTIYGNWKLYTDNLRDPNHGGLLHMFQITFGLARLSQWGGARMDRRHRHNISFTAENTEVTGATKSYGETARGDQKIKLLDKSMLQYRPEYPDRMSLSITSIFPSVTFQQIANSLATRQIRPKSADEFEIYSTYFGYADDDDDLTQHRLKQANLSGPGGYISMEDGEAVEIVHRASARERDACAVVEIGGRGAPVDQETLVTEVPMRGFWIYYTELMGFASGLGR